MKKRPKQDKYFNKEIAPYYPAVYRYLLKLGCEEDLANDMAQETMKAAWEHIDELMILDHKIYWLLTVAKNKYFSYARLVFHKYEYLDEDFVLADYENSKILKDISNIFVRQESHEILEKALSLMDNKYSDLIRMRYFGDYTYHEISEQLGINENTIRSAIMRGHHKLAKILTDLGYIKEDI